MISSYYMQVLSLGLVWTVFHCSGMCGPLVAGLTSRASDPPERSARLWLRFRRVLSYQLGRSLTYASLGAIVGLAGAFFESAIRDVAAMSGFVIAPILAIAGFAKLLNVQPKLGAGAKVSAHVMTVMRSLMPKLREHKWLSFVATGAMMGLLPCGQMFWTLGVAGATASPLHGAGVMLLLVAMTTPVLVVAGCAAGITKLRWSERLVGLVLLLSAGWMLLVALAANGIIDHAMTMIHIGDECYHLMFF